MRRVKLTTLGKINQRYKGNIFDTSALMGYLDREGKSSINDSERFAKFLIDKDYNSFIPNSVRWEYRRKNPTKIGKALIKRFEMNNRVLLPKDSPLGSKVKERYTKLKNIINGCPIHSTDLRVISWTLELNSLHDSPFAILSNDMGGMAKFWRKLINTNYISIEDIGFFPRRGLDLYEDLAQSTN